MWTPMHVKPHERVFSTDHSISEAQERCGELHRKMKESNIHVR